MHPGCYNWCSIKFLHFHLTSFGLRNMAAVVVGKGCGGKPHPPCYLHQRQFPFKKTAMTVAEFVCMVSGEGKRRNEFAEWHMAWLAE